MRKIIFLIVLSPFLIFANGDSFITSQPINTVATTDSIFDEAFIENEVSADKEELSLLKEENIVAWRLQQLDKNTPMDLVYNDKVQPFIVSYLGRN